VAGEPNYGGRQFPETLPRMVAESTSELNTNGYETRSLKQKQRIYLLKTIIQKIKKYAKTDGQEDLFETSDWQLCFKSAVPSGALSCCPEGLISSCHIVGFFKCHAHFCSCPNERYSTPYTYVHKYIICICKKPFHPRQPGVYGLREGAGQTTAGASP
jgi:hypothetical protein